MPVTAKAHHTQFWLTPPLRTRSVTRFGVSVENVVATSDTPSSHHDNRRPDRKNSARPEPARRITASPTARQRRPYSASTTQSQPFSRMRVARIRPSGSRGTAQRRQGARPPAVHPLGPPGGSCRTTDQLTAAHALALRPPPPARQRPRSTRTQA